MTRNQAREIMLRGMLRVLWVQDAHSLVPDWDLHKPENRALLWSVREEIIADLTRAVGIYEEGVNECWDESATWEHLTR